MSEALAFIQSNRYLYALAIVVAAVLAGFLVELITTRILLALTRKTRTSVDDEIVEALKRPLFLSLVFAGSAYALHQLGLPDTTLGVLDKVLITLGILVWTRGGMSMGQSVLGALARKADSKGLVQQRTLPLFEITIKTLIVGGAAYGVLIAWHVDVTAWLASAGILGIAIGFASKDTLANLFAGIFILADAPYKLGDFVVLDSGERGKVTDIGIRSTRILTRDDIQIIIPNAAIGAAKIINETGGPHPKRRVRVSVGVAYGSDVAQVKEILMDVAQKCQYVVSDPEPRVRFRTFGESSLDFQLMGWIDEPVLRGRAVDELNTQVYNRFAEAGIRIPFPQRDVHFDKESKR
jgi:MscS family membrane protein